MRWKIFKENPTKNVPLSSKFYDSPSLLLGAFIIVSFYLPLGFVPLFDLDEGAFSEATREMLASGDYLTTYLGGELRFDKPILIYWLQALCVSVFGLNEWALRLPSALASTGWTLMIYLFTRRYYGTKAAFLSAIIMIGSLQIALIAKAAIADALLNCLLAGSMLTMYRFFDSRNSRYLYATFAFIGLGVLTKGPVAILIPLAVSGIFALTQKEWRLWLQALSNPIGWLIFLSIATPWYILEYMEQGQRFIDGFFLKHNVSRFGGSMEGHGGSLLYYIPVVLLGMLPFTALLFRKWQTYQALWVNPLDRFLLIWFLFVFLFFSLSGTKLPHYVIYGYTPLFILMGRLAVNDAHAFRFLWPSLALLLVLFLLPWMLPSMTPLIKDSFTQAVLADASSQIPVSYSLALFLAIGFMAWGWRSAQSLSWRFFILGLAFTTAINFAVMPLVANFKQTPIKEAALLAKDKGWNVKMIGINTPSFMVYYEGITPKTKSLQAGDVFLTKSTRLEQLPEHEILYEKNGIVLGRTLTH